MRHELRALRDADEHDALTRPAVQNAYDRSLARRAFALSLLASIIVVLVVVTTDEGAGFARRAALCAMLAPLSGALGAFGASRLARARGELRALEAIGVHPARAPFGATIGGALVGFVGTIVVLAGVADLEPLFPRPVESASWVETEGGGMREVTRGVLVGRGGSLAVEPPSEVASDRAIAEQEDRRRAVSLALLLLSLSAPLAATRADSSARRLASLAAIGLALIAAFQLVAARRAVVWIVCAPPLALLANALAARYRPPPSR